MDKSIKSNQDKIQTDVELNPIMSQYDTGPSNWKHDPIGANDISRSKPKKTSFKKTSQFVTDKVAQDVTQETFFNESAQKEDKPEQQGYFLREDSKEKPVQETSSQKKQAEKASQEFKPSAKPTSKIQAANAEEEAQAKQSLKQISAAAEKTGARKFFEKTTGAMNTMSPSARQVAAASLVLSAINASKAGASSMQDPMNMGRMVSKIAQKQSQIEAGMKKILNNPANFRMTEFDGAGSMGQFGSKVRGGDENFVNMLTSSNSPATRQLDNAVKQGKEIGRIQSEVAKGAEDAELVIRNTANKTAENLTTGIDSVSNQARLPSQDPFNVITNDQFIEQIDAGRKNLEIAKKANPNLKIPESVNNLPKDLSTASREQLISAAKDGGVDPFKVLKPDQVKEVFGNSVGDLDISNLNSKQLNSLSKLTQKAPLTGDQIVGLKVDQAVTAQNAAINSVNQLKNTNAAVGSVVTGLQSNVQTLQTAAKIDETLGLGFAGDLAKQAGKITEFQGDIIGKFAPVKEQLDFFNQFTALGSNVLPEQLSGFAKGITGPIAGLNALGQVPGDFLQGLSGLPVVGLNLVADGVMKGATSVFDTIAPQFLKDGMNSLKGIGDGIGKFFNDSANQLSKIGLGLPAIVDGYFRNPSALAPFQALQAATNNLFQATQLENQLADQLKKLQAFEPKNAIIESQIEDTKNKLAQAKAAKANANKALQDQTEAAKKFASDPENEKAIDEQLKKCIPTLTDKELEEMDDLKKLELLNRICIAPQQKKDAERIKENGAFNTNLLGLVGLLDNKEQAKQRDKQIKQNIQQTAELIKVGGDQQKDAAKQQFDAAKQQVNDQANQLKQIRQDQIAQGQDAIAQLDQLINDPNTPPEVVEQAKQQKAQIEQAIDQLQQEIVLIDQQAAQQIAELDGQQDLVFQEIDKQVNQQIAQAKDQTEEVFEQLDNAVVGSELAEANIAKKIDDFSKDPQLAGQVPALQQAQGQLAQGTAAAKAARDQALQQANAQLAQQQGQLAQLQQAAAEQAAIEQALAGEISQQAAGEVAQQAGQEIAADQIAQQVGQKAAEDLAQQATGEVVQQVAGDQVAQQAAQQVAQQAANISPEQAASALADQLAALPPQQVQAIAQQAASFLSPDQIAQAQALAQQQGVPVENVIIQLAQQVVGAV